MNDFENHLDIQQRPDLPVKFRDDLRIPSVQWGRCCVTGEWGPVIAIDLGNISIEAPRTDKGVVYDPETGDVQFTLWRPVNFEQQANFSMQGLEMLMAYLKDQKAPVPSVTPVLVYMWQVLYNDGSALAQFEHDPIESKEFERHSGAVDFPNVAQLSVVSRTGELPTYTFVRESGKFFRNGEEIDPEYDNPQHYDPDKHECYYGRKVTHTFGTVIGDGLEREISCVATTVLQLLGWKTKGEDPTAAESAEYCCVISIDNRGNWRPWKYIE